MRYIETYEARRMTHSQESRVSSSQDTLLLREENRTSVSALVNGINACLSGADVSVNNESLKVEKMAATSNQEGGKQQCVYRWLPRFEESCRSSLGCKSIKKLECLMSTFLGHVSESVKECYTRPNRAAKLRKCLNETLMFFHMFYQDVRKPGKRSLYLELMTDLVAMYIDMEIKAACRQKEKGKKITSRVTSSLYLLLDKSEDHVLDAILKAKLINKNNKDVCLPMLGKIVNQVPLPLTEMSYVRYLLIFKLFKKVIQSTRKKKQQKSEEEKRINKLAVLKLKPPDNFVEKAKIFTNVLPKIPPKSKKNVTHFFMQAKLNLKSACAAFLKGVKEFQESLYGSTDKDLFCSKQLTVSPVNNDKVDGGVGSNGFSTDMWSSLDLESLVQSSQVKELTSSKKDAGKKVKDKEKVKKKKKNKNVGVKDKKKDLEKIRKKKLKKNKILGVCGDSISMLENKVLGSKKGKGDKKKKKKNVKAELTSSESTDESVSLPETSAMIDSLFKEMETLRKMSSQGLSSISGASGSSNSSADSQNVVSTGTIQKQDNDVEMRDVSEVAPGTSASVRNERPTTTVSTPVPSFGFVSGVCTVPPPSLPSYTSPPPPPPTTPLEQPTTTTPHRGPMPPYTGLYPSDLPSALHQKCNTDSRSASPAMSSMHASTPSMVSCSSSVSSPRRTMSNMCSALPMGFSPSVPPPPLPIYPPPPPPPPPPPQSSSMHTQSSYSPLSSSPGQPPLPRGPAPPLPPLPPASAPSSGFTLPPLSVPPPHLPFYSTIPHPPTPPGALSHSMAHPSILLSSVLNAPRPAPPLSRPPSRPSLTPPPLQTHHPNTLLSSQTPPPPPPPPTMHPSASILPPPPMPPTLPASHIPPLSNSSTPASVAVSSLRHSLFAGCIQPSCSSSPVSATIGATPSSSLSPPPSSHTPPPRVPTPGTRTAALSTRSVPTPPSVSNIPVSCSLSSRIKREASLPNSVPILPEIQDSPRSPSPTDETVSPASSPITILSRDSSPIARPPSVCSPVPPPRSLTPQSLHCSPLRTVPTPPPSRTIATPPLSHMVATQPLPPPPPPPPSLRTSATQSPSRTSATPPPSRTSAPPPSRTSATPPPSRTSATPPPSRTSATPPPLRTSATPPPSHATATPPSSRTNAIPPSSRSSATSPSSHASTTLPPSRTSAASPSSCTSASSPFSCTSATSPYSSASATSPPSYASPTPLPSRASAATQPSRANATLLPSRTNTTPPPSCTSATPPPLRTILSSTPSLSVSTPCTPPLLHTISTTPSPSQTISSTPPPLSVSTTPPPLSVSTTPPPLSVSTTPPPLSVSTTPPPLSVSTTPPPSTTVSTTPPTLHFVSNTPPPFLTISTTPPPTLTPSSPPQSSPVSTPPSSSPPPSPSNAISSPLTSLHISTPLHHTAATSLCSQTVVTPTPSQIINATPLVYTAALSSFSATPPCTVVSPTPSHALSHAMSPLPPPLAVTPPPSESPSPSSSSVTPAAPSETLPSHLETPFLSSVSPLPTVSASVFQDAIKQAPLSPSESIGSPMSHSSPASSPVTESADVEMGFTDPEASLVHMPSVPLLTSTPALLVAPPSYLEQPTTTTQAMESPSKITVVPTALLTALHLKRQKDSSESSADQVSASAIPCLSPVVAPSEGRLVDVGAEVEVQEETEAEVPDTLTSQVEVTQENVLLTTNRVLSVKQEIVESIGEEKMVCDSAGENILTTSDVCAEKDTIITPEMCVKEEMSYPEERFNPIDTVIAPIMQARDTVIASGSCDTIRPSSSGSERKTSITSQIFKPEVQGNEAISSCSNNHEKVCMDTVSPRPVRDVLVSDIQRSISKDEDAEAVPFCDSSIPLSDEGCSPENNESLHLNPIDIDDSEMLDSFTASQVTVQSSGVFSTTNDDVVYDMLDGGVLFGTHNGLGLMLDTSHQEEPDSPAIEVFNSTDRRAYFDLLIHLGGGQLDLSQYGCERQDIVVPMDQNGILHNGEIGVVSEKSVGHDEPMSSDENDDDDSDRVFLVRPRTAEKRPPSGVSSRGYTVILGDSKDESDASPSSVDNESVLSSPIQSNTAYSASSSLYRNVNDAVDNGKGRLPCSAENIKTLGGVGNAHSTTIKQGRINNIRSCTSTMQSLPTDSSENREDSSPEESPTKVVVVEETPRRAVPYGIDSVTSCTVKVHPLRESDARKASLHKEEEQRPQEAPKPAPRGMLLDTTGSRGKMVRPYMDTMYRGVPLQAPLPPTSIPYPAISNPMAIGKGAPLPEEIRCPCADCYAYVLFWSGYGTIPSGGPPLPMSFHEPHIESGTDKLKSAEKWKSENEELLRRIEESLTKDKLDSVVDSSLPPKKRLKTIAAVSNIKSESSEKWESPKEDSFPSYPTKPMISIAELDYTGRFYTNHAQRPITTVMNNMNNPQQFLPYAYYEQMPQSREANKFQNDMQQYRQCGPEVPLSVNIQVPNAGKEVPVYPCCNTHVNQVIPCEKPIKYQSPVQREYTNKDKVPTSESVPTIKVEMPLSSQNTAVNSWEYSGRQFKTPAQLKEIPALNYHVGMPAMKCDGSRSESNVMPNSGVYVPKMNSVEDVKYGYSQYSKPHALDLSVEENQIRISKSRRRKNNVSGENNVRPRSSKRSSKNQNINQNTAPSDPYFSAEKRMHRKHVSR